MLDGSEISSDIPATPSTLEWAGLAHRLDHARHACSSMAVVTGQAVVVTFDRQASEQAGLRAIEDRALFWILRGNLDEATSHPTHDDRVVEVQGTWVVRADDRALDAAL